MSPARWTYLFLVVAACGLVDATATSAIQSGQRDPVSGVTQATVAGTAAIEGVVTSDDPNSRPIRGAIVTVRSGDGLRPRAAVTDDAGRFSLSELPAGRFTITVMKAGWLTTIYGAKRPWKPPGVAIALTSGQRVTNISVKMPRGAVITGHIADETGRPVVGVSPMLLEIRSIAGERKLLQTQLPDPAPDPTSDDRGEYRFYGLPPGSYLMAVPIASTGPGQSGFRPTTAEDIMLAQANAAAGNARPAATPLPIQKYAATFYPNTGEWQSASLITLGAGEERRGIDVTVRTVPTIRLEGIVTRPDGLPEPNARVTSLGLSSAGAAAGTAAAIQGGLAAMSPDGSFVFNGIRPGRFVIRARASSASGSAGTSVAPGQPGRATPTPAIDLWASTEVVVTGDNANLVLTLQPGTTVRGRVLLDGAASLRPEDLSTARVRLVEKVPGGGAPSIETTALVVPRLAADGTFTLAGIPPGHYDIVAEQTSVLADRWLVRSIFASGRDATTTGLDIAAGQADAVVTVTFTDRVSELTGLLTDGAGRPVPEYYVFAFPADRSAWTETSRLRAPIRPSTDGRYRIAPLLPGDYYVVALTAFDEIDYLDAEFLAQLVPASVAVTLRGGQSTVQDLRLATGGT